MRLALVLAVIAVSLQLLAVNGRLLLQSNSNSDDVILGQISAGENHACGIKADGTAWCWGVNYYGDLGGGTAPGTWNTEVAGGGSWIQISAGYLHTCGIKADGTAWCWGSKDYGQLGDGITSDIGIPTLVAGGGSWMQIRAGS